MFFNNVCQGIDLLSLCKFENNEIEIKLNEDATLFLCGLNEFDPIVAPKKCFKPLLENNVKIGIIVKNWN